jgi:hypothetical protein
MQECLVAAGEKALVYLHQQYVATRCELRVETASKSKPPRRAPDDCIIIGPNGKRYC